jgi:DNA ligase-1
MNRFASLIERLEAEREEETAARVLADYLARTNDFDRGHALGALVGATPLARAGRPVLRALAERLEPELLAISQEVVRDLGETIALMWPAPAGGAQPPSLIEIVEALGRASREPEGFAALLAGWLDRLDPAARVALIRLASGELSGLLPVRVVQAALARLGGAPIAEVEAVWHADAPPYEALLGWARGMAPKPPPAQVARFQRLAEVRALTSAERAGLDPSSLIVEHAWDGLRVLAVVERGERRLYTRRGEDVTARFPEIADALAIEAAFEGVILMRDAEGRLARAALEARLGRRRRGRAAEPAALLLVHDLLALSGEDLRELALRERRARLEALAARLPAERVALTSVAPATDWLALDAARAQARIGGAAGVMLKAQDATYSAAAWLEWRCDPLSARLVLLTLERGPDAPTATLGAWSGDRLVTVAKATLGEDGTAAAIADYVSERRVDRFGPVEQVRADTQHGLVVEAAFEAVEPAPRRKAGLVLRGAQVSAVRDDLTPTDAARVEALLALLG